jgi:capsule polysaccharide export protein KpsE/RkpR
MVNELELEMRRLSAFEDDEAEPQGKPLHEQVSFLLGKIALLWGERRRLFGWTLGAMVVTLLLMFLVPNQYQASAYLNPPDMSPMSGLSLMIGMKSGLAAGLGSSMGDMLGLKSPGQICIRQMQSRVVQDAMIRRFDLMRVYKTKKLDETRKLLLARSDFEEDKKSGALEISVLDKDPNRAAQMANAYVEELGNLTAAMNAESGRREREYFEAQLLLAKTDFRHASEELGSYGGQKGALDPEHEGKAMADAVAAIEGNLIATKSELKGLQQIYTDSNTQVQQTKARIAELAAQLARVSHGSQVQKPSSATGASAETFDSARETDPSVRRMWGLAPSYMNLYGEMKIKEAVVQTLAEQYEIAKLQETRHISDLHMMDRAQPPEKKAKPHRGLMTLLAGFLVFSSLSSWILSKHEWNSRDDDDPWKQILQPAVTAFQERRVRAEARKTQAGEPAPNPGLPNEGRS